jgi:hypothetical protein
VSMKTKIAKTIVVASTVTLLTLPAVAGYGPGDGTGNGGVGPKDGSGYGAKKGNCVKMVDHESLSDLIARGGNGNGNVRQMRRGGGGYGPGDGTGNGGVGPGDGTGNGAKNGTCINS